jgi:ADP-ribose pyrophosphatase YjhB (NUDIX family)
VGAVVLVGRRLVLVRRARPPLAGRWSLPGGHLELGETVRDGVRREVREETGLEVEVGPLVDVVDRMAADAAGGVGYHFVLVDFVCRGVGEPVAGSDAGEVALVEPDDLARFGLAGSTEAVIRRALHLAASHPWQTAPPGGRLS